MIDKIGNRAHDLGKKNLNDISGEIRELGFETTQLALKKAVLGFDNFDILDEEYAKLINENFMKEGLDISVLGCYLNYATPDLNVNKLNMEIMKKHIELSNIMGAGLVGTETGSLNEDYSFNKENHSEKAYHAFAKSLYKILEYAEENNAEIAIEAVAKHIINTPKRMHRILRDMQSKYLKVIFDPINLLTFENYQKLDDLIKESFELFGGEIKVVHLKDFLINKDNIELVPFGFGNFNHKYLFQILKGTNQKFDLLIENVPRNKVNHSISVVRNLIDNG